MGMNIERIDHLAICVRDLDAATKQMEAMGAEMFHRKANEATGLASAQFKWGNITVTLEHPTSDRGPFAEFLRRHGEGIHHIGMDVENLDDALATLDQNEMRVVNAQREGDVRHEVLVHPKSGLGVLWQLMEWQGEYKTNLEKRLEAAQEGKIDIPGATRPV
jgi:methylmalonyl-CoA/ethylmalonyl-CoA epimerase